MPYFKITAAIIAMEFRPSFTQSDHKLRTIAATAIDESCSVAEPATSGRAITTVANESAVVALELTEPSYFSSYLKQRQLKNDQL